MATPSHGVQSVLAALLLACGPQASAADADPYAAKRQTLMREIERDVRETASYLNRRKLDDRVMAAMASVPRHEFVHPDERAAAY
jgi:protein-L-isoaspartate(D-aspartate) O-methyltransferase